MSDSEVRGAKKEGSQKIIVDSYFKIGFKLIESSYSVEIKLKFSLFT